MSWYLTLKVWEQEKATLWRAVCKSLYFSKDRNKAEKATGPYTAMPKIESQAAMLTAKRASFMLKGMKTSIARISWKKITNRLIRCSPIFNSNRRGTGQTSKTLTTKSSTMMMIIVEKTQTWTATKALVTKLSKRWQTSRSRIRIPLIDKGKWTIPTTIVPWGLMMTSKCSRFKLNYRIICLLSITMVIAINSRSHKTIA